jgi:hypothetical protein
MIMAYIAFKREGKAIEFGRFRPVVPFSLKIRVAVVPSGVKTDYLTIQL